MYCTRCGVQLDDTVCYCSHCGSEFLNQAGEASMIGVARSVDYDRVEHRHHTVRPEPAEATCLLT